MKILVVAPQPFFASRGTPLSVYYRTLMVGEQGQSMDLLTYGCGEQVDIPGARIVRIPRLPFLEPVPIGPSWQKLGHDVLMVLWTIGLLLRHRYDVVHAHEEAVFWCRFLKPLFRFRLIYDMHSSLPQQLANFRFSDSRLLVGTFRWLEDSCLRAADAVITICPDLSQYALGAGVPAEKHLLIENSIFEDVRVVARADERSASAAPEPVALGSGDRVVLYAGTFEVYQGVATLVEAFASVVKRRLDARLLLIGGTDEQVREVGELARSLQLGERCLLTGQLPKSMIAGYVQRADVLVSPRMLGTNTPLKIYEYLASGKPIVATRIWSHTQVLDDTTAWLVEPDAPSLAQGIIQALDDAAGSAGRSANARALFESRYSRREYARKINRLLEIVS